MKKDTIKIVVFAVLVLVIGVLIYEIGGSSKSNFAASIAGIEGEKNKNDITTPLATATTTTVATTTPTATTKTPTPTQKNSLALVDVTKTDKTKAIAAIQAHFSTLSGYKDLQISGNAAIANIWFKNSDGKDEMATYFLNLADPNAQPRKIFNPENYSEQTAFGAALSPDGSEIFILDHDGSVSVLKTATGVLTKINEFKRHDDSWPAGDYKQEYSNPIYTLDGKHIIFHSLWQNALFSISASTKDFNAIHKFSGVYIMGFPKEGLYYTMYDMLADGKGLYFSGKYLDLAKLP